jgi:ribokinase
MALPRILVIGSSNTDMVLEVQRLPAPGETVLGGGFSMAAGGKGANQAVAAARAGGDVSLIARVGDDAFGRQAVEGLRQEGIDLTYLVRDPDAPSGVALIFVSRKGENCIAVGPGANGRLATADIERAARAFAAAAVVVAQLETPLETVLAAATQARNAGATFVLNPAPAQPLPDALLQAVSILTPNETEAERLTGIPVDGLDGAERAARALREKGVGTVIVTMGSKGALVCRPSCTEFVPAFSVQAIDTVAAGDTFNGALAVALGEGRPLLDAVDFANAAAAIAVTRRGAQASCPARAEIERFLQSR